MEFFSHRTHIDFMAQRRWAALLSILLFTLSLLSIAVHGLNMGLDFTGGSQLQFNFPQGVDAGRIRNTLEKNGFEEAIVQSYGNSQDVLITVPAKSAGQGKQAVGATVQQLFPEA